MLNLINSLNIRQRLLAGFGTVALILAAAIIITLIYVTSTSNQVDKIVSLRVPTSQASSAMVNNINASLASLRGWMLTGNDVFKTERHAVWADIDIQKTNMDRLSQTWTNPDNVKVWNEFKVTLEEFRGAQKEVEDIANSPNEQPAMQILLNDAAPRAGLMVQKITEMIDIEATLEATPARKNLLGIMADIRGTTAIGLANIRAMLLTGNKDFQTQYEATSAKNIRRFADLEGNINRLTTAQRAAFDDFKSARAEFLNYPPQMFEIRGSNQWNMANYTLISKAAPRAGELLSALAGPKGQDGVRAGGMVDNQKGLLNNDAANLQSDISFLKTLEWIILFSGIGIAALLALKTSQAISKPVIDITKTMTNLAEGDTKVTIPHTKRSDEIGDIALSVEVFKNNAIERVRLEEEAKQEEVSRQERQEKRKEEELAAEREVNERREKRAKLISSLIEDFDAQVRNVLSGVTSASTELEATAESMSHLAEGSQRQATEATSASEQASSNVQAVASASEEMSISVNEIARQVEVSTEINEKAVQEANGTSKIVEGLSDTTSKIGDVVNFINDIAEQTNLLALNATIEAARAGDAGRGFAVVAAEVKDLATQTAKATEEISGQIVGVQKGSKEASEAMDNILSVINQTKEVSSDIASAVEQQSSATSEISRNAQQAAKGTELVNNNMVEVNEGSVQTKAAADQVLSASRELAHNGESLKGVIDQFLEGIKAA